tara:strand:- start:601 stop:1092 length:492 start_codon:yes stop_codon:yes gene_type:complete
MATEKNFPSKWITYLREMLDEEYGIPMEETEELPEIITDSIICKIFALGRNWAVTLNGKVYMTPLFFQRQKEDEAEYGAWYANRQYFALYSHEMYHAVEQRRLGMVKYLSKYIPLMLKWGGRSKHPMEAPAYKIGNAMFAKLQTSISKRKINGKSDGVAAHPH